MVSLLTRSLQWYYSATIFLHSKNIGPKPPPGAQSDGYEASHRICSEAAGEIVALLRCLDNFKILVPASSDLIHMLSHAALVCLVAAAGRALCPGTNFCRDSSTPTMLRYRKMNTRPRPKPISSNAASGCKRSAKSGLLPLSSANSSRDVSPRYPNIDGCQAHRFIVVVKGGKELTAKNRNPVSAAPDIVLTSDVFLASLPRSRSRERRKRSPL